MSYLRSATKTDILSRTTVSELVLNESKQVIANSLLPNLIGNGVNTRKYREASFLPVRDGGLNIMLPRDCEEEFQRSKAVSVCLENPDPFDCELSQQQMLNQIKKDKSDNLQHKKVSIRLKLTDEELYSLDLVSGKGASCWLNALPIKRYNFNLTKPEFHDGIALRYGWEPRHLQVNCPCGKDFSISHALHCAKGASTLRRHDAIRDTFAKIMDDVCYDVEMEPHLQPLQGESFDFKTTTTEDQDRLDIRANGLWEIRFSKTFSMGTFLTLSQKAVPSQQ